MVGRHPGGSRNYPKRMIIVFNEEGIDGPKLWNCDDLHKCFAGKKIPEILKSKKLTKLFVKRIKKDPEHFILLLHESKGRAELIEKLLGAFESEQFEESEI